MRTTNTISAVLTAFLLMSGCARQGGSVWDSVLSFKQKHPYAGEKYPPADKVTPAFLSEQVPVGCRVFAHALVWIPAGSTGRGIAQAVAKEAGSRGADSVLVGRSRRAEDDKGLKFAYYGPEQPYDCREAWNGWKFGYDEWVEQGSWVGIGYDEWGNQNIRFDYPLVLQTAFIRCQKN